MVKGEIKMPTIKKQVSLSGVGIHSGLPVNVVIKPTKKYGIFMKRVDLPESELIAAKYDNVVKQKCEIQQLDAQMQRTCKQLNI